MSSNVGRALQEGIVRTVEPNGRLFVVVMTVTSAPNVLTYRSAVASVIPAPPDRRIAVFGPALPISPLVAGAAIVFLYIASFVVTAAALRTFVTDETGTILREYVTRNLGWFLVNYVVGYVVFLVAVWIGAILLVVPGIFLLVSRYFWFVLVAVEDQNFVEAFRNSWALAKGNWWQLAGLRLIVLVVGAILYGVLFALAFVTSPWITLFVFAVVVAAFGVFSLATTARAYVQLEGGRSTGERAAPT